MGNEGLNRKKSKGTGETKYKLGDFCFCNDKTNKQKIRSKNIERTLTTQ